MEYDGVVVNRDDLVSAQAFLKMRIEEIKQQIQDIGDVLAADSGSYRQPPEILQDEMEYTLDEGAGVWIGIGLGSLRVKHSADGVIVTLYRKGEEDCDEVAEIAEVWGDLMPEDEE